RAAADAVKTHTDRINENMAMALQAAGADLSYEASLLSLESAQKNLTEAVRQHGPASFEARSADNAYQQQLLATVDALGAKVAAENAHKSAAEITTAVTQAEYAEILRLAAAAGENAPAALQKMISSMDGAALAAMGVTVKVNETGQAIVTMPDGKQIVIDGNNAEAMAAIAAVNAAQIQGKTLWITAVMRNDAKVAADWGVGGMNDGGWVPGDGPDKDGRMRALTSKVFVVNRRAAAKWGPWAERINSANGGDMKMPDAGLPNAGALSTAQPSIPFARIPAPAGSMAVRGSDGAAVTKNFYITLNAIKSLPTPQQLVDVLHDAEVLYG